MASENQSTTIRWSLHLAAPPARVYQLLATDEGRASFWAEMSRRDGQVISFHFPNGLVWRGRVLAEEPARRFTLEYIGGSLTSFELFDDGAGGTDLRLSDSGTPAAEHAEVSAGWVSVLLTLKAAVDFGVDLRNHDPLRTWDQGYVDN